MSSFPIQANLVTIANLEILLSLFKLDRSDVGLFCFCFVVWSLSLSNAQWFVFIFKSGYLLRILRLAVLLV